MAETLKFRSICFCLLLLSPLSQGTASLLAMDWADEGDGLLTYDSGTALEWLDLTATRNLTVTQARDSWIADGFRYASQEEVETLFRNGGMTAVTVNDENPIATTDNLDPVNRLIDLLGETGAGERDRYVNGIYGVEWVVEPGFPPYAEYRSALLNAALDSTAFALVDPLPYTAGNAELFPSRSDVGLFLVRKATVAEPSGAALVAGSVLGFLLFKRRRSTPPTPLHPS